MATVLIVTFLACLVIGVPVALAMGVATLAAFLVDGTLPLEVFAQRVFSGLDAFSLMAIPFFILAGDLMTSGRLTDVLIEFARDLVGHIAGGLGHVNVLVSTFFAGISGSALADAAGPGAIEMQIMHKAGYDPHYAGALSAASAVIGPIIPPSILMIVYALSEGRTTVTGLFLAGVVPGLLLAAALMTTHHMLALRRGYRFADTRRPLPALLRSALRALPALLMPAIILGGILGGIFTATEASAVAVAYGLLVGALGTRALTARGVLRIVARSAVVSSGVLLLIAMGSAFSWVLTYAQVPQQVAASIARLTDDPRLVMLLIAGVTFITGMFVDTLPALIILTPVLAPVAAQFGADPLHTAVVIVLMLAVGMLTPPVAPLLFVISSVGRLRFERLCVAVVPFLLAEVAVILLVTLVPALSTALPRALGYLQ